MVLLVAISRGPGVPMVHALRKTGIPLVETIPWGSHIALFYETEADLLDTCVAYFEAGLQNNEFCTWALVNSVTLDTARQALRSSIPNFDRYEAAGSIELISLRELNFSDQAFDLQWVLERWRARLRRAFEGGYEGVRMSGHAWVATSQSEQYFEHQRKIAAFREGKPMLAMATHEIGDSRAVDVLDVIRVHDLTIARRHGAWQFMETPGMEQTKTPHRRPDGASAIISTPFPGHEKLTERERVVLAHIVQGASSKEIARDLGVSPRTVDFHRANILQKLGARNTADVIRAVLS